MSTLNYDRFITGAVGPSRTSICGCRSRSVPRATGPDLQLMCEDCWRKRWCTLSFYDDVQRAITFSNQATAGRMD